MSQGTGNVRGVHVRCNVQEHELVAWYARQIGKKAGPLLRVMPFDVAVKYARRLRVQTSKPLTTVQKAHLLADEAKRYAKWLEQVEAVA